VSWTLVLPLKRLELAKSRLRAEVAGADRVALAFAADTLAAVAATEQVSSVVVVTADPELAALARGHGAEVVPDTADGLDAAVTLGLVAPRRAPLAVLLGDLPALRPAELADALTHAARHPRSMVADAAGTGTTLLADTQGAPIPRFGAGSRARHEAAGHVVLDAAPGLRRDVDTVADLAEALRLGVGAATAAAVAALAL
jgi:2-phospho-L-lactate guanylyltransferase